MANYMAEVAKMLGVELGEEFEINGYNGHKFMFKNDGLHILTVHQTYCDSSNPIIGQLIVGSSTIKRKPWKPTKEDNYFCIYRDGSCVWHGWDNSVIDLNHYKLGNCYRTKQEAETNRDKWISFYASDEVLEV